MFAPSSPAEPALPNPFGLGNRAASFAGFPPGHFGAIYADPPWRFATYSDKGRDRSPDYREMSLEEIAVLPVASLAKPDCVLLLWPSHRCCRRPSPRSRAGVSRSDRRLCLAAHIGMGFWTRQQSEFCLLATRGRPKRLHADVCQGITEARREHSRKPDCVRGRIERLTSGPHLAHDS
jgi:N6-adenosine-specific RNA methylase IME4